MIALSLQYHGSRSLKPRERRACLIVSDCLCSISGYMPSQCLYLRLPAREGGPRLVARSLAQPAVHRAARALCTARNTCIAIGIQCCGFLRALSSSIGTTAILRSLAKTTVFLACIMKFVHLYGASTTKTTKTLGHRSANLVGMVVARHNHGCSAQRGVCVWPRAGMSISFEFNGEVSFEVLSLLRSAGGFHASYFIGKR